MMDVDRVQMGFGGDNVSERPVPFQLRGRSFTAMVLRLTDPDHRHFFSLLADKLRQAPNFFRDAPIVIDLEEVVARDWPIDLPEFVARLRALKLAPIGVQNGSRPLNDSAVTCGLAVLQGGRDALGQSSGGQSSGGQSGNGADSRAGPGKSTRQPSKMVTEPVRSGQQVFADRGDLIVTAAVSSGAELIADGNIHVYGPLRGRALAGVNGDQTARIFCLSLEAELIAVAGLYKVSEDLDPSVWRKRVQISLVGDNLFIQDLG